MSVATRPRSPGDPRTQGRLGRGRGRHGRDRMSLGFDPRRRAASFSRFCGGVHCWLCGLVRRNQPAEAFRHESTSRYSTPELRPVRHCSPPARGGDCLPVRRPARLESRCHQRDCDGRRRLLGSAWLALRESRLAWLEDAADRTPSEAAFQAGSESPSDEPEWTLVIRPKGRWFDLRLRELWQGRELIWLFFWRDFVALYKQTILGPLVVPHPAPA